MSRVDAYYQFYKNAPEETNQDVGTSNLEGGEFAIGNLDGI